MATKHVISPPRREQEAGEKSELQRILASGILSKAPNLAKLLNYICARYWEGEIESIKEYRLGVEALGRPPDFDPASNPIVRVELHRLREKLNKYYQSEGADHQLVITLQPGRYIPQFVPRGVAVAAHPEAAGSAVRTYWKFIPVAVGAAVLIAAVSFVLILRRPRTAARGKAPVLAEKPIVALPGALSDVRIIAGYTGKEQVDHSGSVWLGDRYFRGGFTRATPSGLILRTIDPALFASCRLGDFSYAIPLKPGDYQLGLYFVEAFYGPGMSWGGGVGSRSFDVQANGRTLLSHFDIFSDAGGNFIGDERVFKDIHPAADGYLHLVFIRESGDPLINAIDISPGTPGKLLPIRIVAQDISYTDHNGERWGPDRYFQGGSLARWTQVAGTSETGLYAGERFGNFNYAIPVAPGKYTVRLSFCEHYFGPDGPGGGGAGSRVFSVFSDGTTLLKNFDIFKEAGGSGKPVVKTFRGVEPNPQGKIDLQFDPEVNNALINAVSVVDESRGSARQ